MASITKLGVWRRTGVRVQHTGRRTHRVHPAKSIVMKRRREARAGIFGRGRENLRDTAHQAMSWNMRTMSSAGRGRRRKAPSISPSSAPALSIVLHACHAALRRAQRRRSAMGAAVWPRQGPPPPHRSARAPDATLRRQLPREPYPSPLPPLRPRAVRSARTAVRRAGGRVAASAPAPSSAGRHSAIIAAFTNPMLRS